MSESKIDLQGDPGLSKEAVDAAKASLAKLPVLGPVIWLYGRDATRRYTFIADLDALLLPPIVLDQCRIYFKAGVPWAFVSWATVNDAVHERLRSGIARIAPHEWKSGPHAWLIEVVCPFGSPDEIIDEIRGGTFAGVTVHQLLPAAGAAPQVKTHAPLAPRAPSSSSAH